MLRSKKASIWSELNEFFFIQNVRQWLCLKFSFSDFRFFEQFVQKMGMSAPDSFAKVVASVASWNFAVAFNGRFFHFNWDFAIFSSTWKRLLGWKAKAKAKTFAQRSAACMYGGLCEPFLERAVSGDFLAGAGSWLRQLANHLLTTH